MTSESRKRFTEVSDGFEVLQVPVQWTERYSKEARANVEHVTGWLNKKQKTRTWLGAAAGVNRSTISQILSGKYPSSPDKFLKKMLDTIHHFEIQSKIKETPFVSTSVSRIVMTACKRARKLHSFAVIAANVGTGKTRTLEEYAATNSNTYLIQADPVMSPGALMDDLIHALGVSALSGRQTREKKLRAVIQYLDALNSPLIILDEAETVNPRTLEHLRRIRDKAGVGVVLSGTTKLYSLVSPKGGQFDQIRSRTCFFPNPIRAITKEDCKAILKESFSDLKEVFGSDGTIDKAILSAFWHHCEGSMRVLVEDLIPAIRDYGLPQHGVLSADLVHAVAKDVLSLR
jgi:DNA transposition AAA+ family ATPase